ncbi:MAG: hypothetical protein FWC13_00435 [Oscillospiraceae bacterium]|nr:hypothetical protein [Oscillospiraceae bacterium]
MDVIESKQSDNSIQEHLCPLCNSPATIALTDERQRISINDENRCFRREVRANLKCTAIHCGHFWQEWKWATEPDHEHNLELVSFNGQVVVQRCSNIVSGERCPRTTVINLKRPIFI